MSVPQLIIDLVSVPMTAYTVGTPITSGLFALILVQWATFMQDSKDEPLLFKTLATIVTLANLCSQIFSMMILHDKGQQALVSPFRLLEIPIALPLGVAGTAVAILCVQIYYAGVVYRKFNCSAIWACTAVFLIATSTAGGIGSVWALGSLAGGGIKSENTVYGGIRLILYSLWLCSATVFDVIVSSTLCFSFFSAMRKAEFAPTVTVLENLLIATLETFSLTATASIVSVVMIFLPFVFDNQVHRLRCYVGSTTTCLVLGRLHAISLLYSLNRRVFLRKQMDATRAGASIPNSHNATALLPLRKNSTGGVHVRTEIATCTDTLASTERDAPYGSIYHIGARKAQHAF